MRRLFHSLDNWVALPRLSRHVRGTMTKFESILDTVGNTRVFRIDRPKPPGIDLFSKIEAFNPLGSVKDRSCPQV